MSSRSSRTRAKTARALASEEQEHGMGRGPSVGGGRKSSSRRSAATPVQKPKYVLDMESRSETPTSSRSRLSTPNSSRATSPLPQPSSRRNSSRKSKSRAVAKNSSGSNTPANRSSRASSVASIGRKEKKVPKLKIKTKLGRGYNPNLVDYKESEYHYGSDFEDEDEPVAEVESEESDSSEVESDAQSDDLNVESDVDMDNIEIQSRPLTPVPFWLRDDIEIPELSLPSSSDDLLIPHDIVVRTCSVYEVLRHYSTILRLSPFRVEDFCAALSSEEQSNLLSEIHISLLRSLLRADEKDQTTYGPMDQKDSLNSIFFFMDTVTWPECLRIYMSIDPETYSEALEIINKSEYPFTTSTAEIVPNRVKMLEILCDQFLATNSVREDIVSEGAQPHEEHCRVCHRLGDLIVCENCSGVYHLACLDPPMDDVPDEDWQCYVCQGNEAPGVTDCEMDNGAVIRHEALGFDRAGNKYWFLCRRLLIEMADGSVRYYSSVKQLEEVLECLDPNEYEQELFAALDNVRLDLENQMQVTEALTTEHKQGTRRSYLELENLAIERVQEQRKEKKQLEIQENIAKAKEDKDAEYQKKKLEWDAKSKEREEEEEKRRKEREDRLRRREESRGDGFPAVDEFMPEEEVITTTEVVTTTSVTTTTTTTVKKAKREDDMDYNPDAEDEVMEEDEGEGGIEMEANEIEKANMETRSRTGSLQPRNFNMDDLKRRSTSILPKEEMENLKEERRQQEADKLSRAIEREEKQIQKEEELKKLVAQAEAGELRMTRRTTQQMSTGTLYYKLGQEGTFRQYVNVYVTNPTALSRAQANEERNKRTHMSHKFSLTEASTFKWVGTLHGNRNQIVVALRHTVLQFENGLPTTFMHPNWPLLRKAWITAVTRSVSARDFARALNVIQSCIKPCLLLHVWAESLGHTHLKKITVQAKEEKKKQEKREKREREEEDARLAPFMSFCKYPLPIRHQVAKQKGEEYRFHGQFGWLWLSSTRSYNPADSFKMGLRAGAYRLAVKYTDVRDNSSKIVLMEPKAFAYLSKRQKSLDIKKEEEGSGDKVTEEEEPVDPNDKQSAERKKLEQALKNARLEQQVPTEEMFKDVIDISACLSNPTRILYPKVAKKCEVLDSFLSRRLQLKTLEEKRIEMKSGKVADNVKVEKSSEEGDVDIEGESDTSTIVTSNLAEPHSENKGVKLQTFLNQAKRAIWFQISKLKEENVAPEAECPSHRPADLKCYSSVCNNNGPEKPYKCYSVTCPLRKETTSPVVRTAHSLHKRLCQEAGVQGLDIKPSDKDFHDRESAISQLQDLVKVLMQKKEELDNYSAVGISTVTTSTTTSVTTKTTEKVTTVNGEIDSVTKTTTTTQSLTNSTEETKSDGEKAETEESKIKVEHKEVTAKKDGEIKAKMVKDETRIYSSSDTTGRLYLKRIQSVAESRKQSKVIKYPKPPSFFGPTRQKYNLLLLAHHDVKHLARRAGVSQAEGFNYNAKSNSLIWPYPCPRPIFKTAWLYRTANVHSIHSVALQLKILWACIKWDDMNIKPISLDGKHQVTTDTQICTTEILKHRNVGRYLEKTQYLQRKVTIPLDLPKNTVEVTPIRTGLRKRTRARSPQQSEPRYEEEWLDEDKLELWEIRAYRERTEREKTVALTRSRTGTAIRGPTRLDPSTDPQKKITTVAAGADIKAKMEEQLRQQREAFQKKTATPISLPNRTISTPTIIRRITNPDGTVQLVKSRQIIPNTPAGNAVAVGTPNRQYLSPTTEEVFISKDGKIIGAQVLPGTPTTGKIAIPAAQVAASPKTIASPVQTAVTTASPQQKVQIVRSNDGKIQVRGLQPGQSLVQMPDGKLQIFSAPNAAAAAAQAQAAASAKVLQPSSAPSTASPTIAATPNRVVNNIQLANASPMLVSPQSATGQAIQPSPTKQPQQVTLAPKTTSNQIIAHHLPPGSQIPPNAQVFMSGGKTYYIQRQTTTVASPAQPQQAIQVQKPIMTVANTTPQKQPQQQTIQIQPQQQLQQPVSTPQQQQQPQQKQVVGMMPLGQYNVVFKDNQMIVSGPDPAQAREIANKLSTGAARLGTVHGKQVLITTAPQPVPKPVTLPQQPVPQQQTVQQTIQQPVQQPVQQPQNSILAAQLTSPQKQPMVVTPGSGTQVPANVQLPTEPLPLVPKPAEPKLTQEEPKQLNVQVTAQLLQTAQGPRIILQGIQGANLTKEQLASIQAQVKSQLLKAQSEAKTQGKVPPTKIAIQLPAAIQQRLEEHHNSQLKSKEIKTESPQQQQVTNVTQQQPQQQQLTVVNQGVGTATIPQKLLQIQQPIAVSSAATGQSGSRPMLIQQGGKMLLVRGPGGTQQIVPIATPAVTSSTPATLPTVPLPQSAVAGTTTADNQGSLLLSSLTSPSKLNSSLNNDKGSETSSADSPDKDFKLTPDYIQQQINDALANKNLSPEIEQKLLALKQHTAEKSTYSHRQSGLGVTKKNQPIDPATGEVMDEEWEPSKWSKKKLSGVVKPPPQRTRPAASNSPATPPAVPQSDGHVASPPIHNQAATLAAVASPPQQPKPRSRSRSGRTGVSDEKRKTQLQNKLNSMLFRHKEQLKKDIAKKRALQEKDLQIEIHRELERLKQQRIGSVTVKEQPDPQPVITNNKRKRQDSEMDSPSPVNPVSSPPSRKKKRTSSSSTAVNAGIIRKDKTYCICKTKYDPSKFYVGCDVCNNWFHGACVGITEEMSKDMTDYVCDECRNAKDNSEIYCLCKQPYDETRFYIGCERCSDWFHGRCVGILQSEADNIDEYMCPRCDPKSRFNRPNTKPLSEGDYELLRKLVKQLMTNRNSWPFKEPVNSNDVPNYYNVVKEPMDLQTVELRVNQNQYEKLTEFIGDVMKIFENCRYFNHPNNQITKSAESLENYFAQKLALLREKLATT